MLLPLRKFLLLMPKLYTLERLVKLIVLVGILLRLTIFAQQRSIVIDEASLIMNCVEHDYASLWGRLDYYQYCPPIFTTIVKSLILLGGNNELMVRLFPLFAGIISLLLFYRLCWRFLSPTASVFALALASFSPYFLEYHVLCKQYASDGMVALLLITLYLEQEDTNFDLRKRIIWILVGSIAIWLSMPSVFTLGAIGITACYQHYKKFNLDWQSFFINWTLVAGVWLINFALFYQLMLKEGIGNSDMVSYHKSYYLNLLPTNLGELKQTGNQLLSTIVVVWGWLGISVALPLVGLLSLLLFRKKLKISYFLLLGLPIFCCLLASSIGMYSLISRMTMFFQFNLLLLVFIGFDFIFSLKYNNKLYIVFKSALILLLSISIFKRACLNNFYQPFKGEWALLRNAVDYIEINQQKYDGIWIKGSCQNSFYYYNQLHEKNYQFNLPIIPELWRCCDETYSYQNILQTKANFQNILIIEDSFNENLFNSYMNQNAGKTKKVFDENGIKLHEIHW